MRTHNANAIAEVMPQQAKITIQQQTKLHKMFRNTMRFCDLWPLKVKVKMIFSTSLLIFMRTIQGENSFAVRIQTVRKRTWVRPNKHWRIVYNTNAWALQFTLTYTGLVTPSTGRKWSYVEVRVIRTQRYISCKQKCPVIDSITGEFRDRNASFFFFFFFFFFLLKIILKAEINVKVVR